MKKALNFVKQKLSLILAVSIVTVVGATTAVVLAAIPDSNGRINACYSNLTKALKVTEPAGNCGGGNTALSWSQSGGGPIAYAHLTYNTTTNYYSLDATRSHNITSFYTDSDGNPDTGDIMCLTVSNTPKSLSLSSAYGSSAPYGGEIKDANGWTGSYGIGTYCNSLSASANVVIGGSGETLFVQIF